MGRIGDFIAEADKEKQRRREDRYGLQVEGWRVPIMAIRAVAIRSDFREFSSLQPADPYRYSSSLKI